MKYLDRQTKIEHNLISNGFVFTFKFYNSFLSSPMGRYAYFSTDFEYKFVFAVQSSSDIDEFGGARTGPFKRQWTKSQAPAIVAQLIAMSDDDKLLHDIEKYQKNVDGTYSMYWDMRDGKYDIDCLYMLGALIHHQLLYTDVLEVTFEV